MSAAPPRLPAALAGDGRPLLLYAGRCPKCRFLSRLVTLLSLGVVRREALDAHAGWQFYRHDYPQAGNYPVLFVDRRPFFGAVVFLAVPWLIVRAWHRALARRLAL